MTVSLSTESLLQRGEERTSGWEATSGCFNSQEPVERKKAKWIRFAIVFLKRSVKSDLILFLKKEKHNNILIACSLRRRSTWAKEQSDAAQSYPNPVCPRSNFPHSDLKCWGTSRPRDLFLLHAEQRRGVCNSGGTHGHSRRCGITFPALPMPDKT